ncbi:MAG: hypothetical protein CVV31_12720 [Methanomicrobiales archaeon HGW-Methanomicrobiales-2]|jgi:predicted RNA binding protein YcfA (HicA-like mRNA interferase family)|nr:MAG: hypothetical protein CVV31_12720 [Methanomicrobiales archaeon HGW-Methanomicrobiales-2]
MSRLPDLPLQTVIDLLRKYGYSEMQRNGRYIHLRHADDDIVITIPNRTKVHGAILRSALCQGGIPEKDFIEGLKGIIPVFGKDSVIAHVDILGFKSLLTEAKKSESKFDEVLNHYHSALRSAFSSIESMTERRHKFNWRHICHVRVYTDNLLFISELGNQTEGEADFGQTIDEIAMYQLELAIRGYFVRGGIVVEKCYCDEVTVFSPALADTEGIEKSAYFPRITLESSAKEKYLRYLKWYRDPAFCYFADTIIIDPDGTWFINYLYILRRFSDDMLDMMERHGEKLPVSEGPYFPAAISELHQHRDHIKKRLTEFEDNPVVFRKYLWLACYHNWFCSKYFSEDGDAEISGVGTTLTFESCFAAKSKVNHTN